jgi:hypothetical protein
MQIACVCSLRADSCPPQCTRRQALDDGARACEQCGRATGRAKQARFCLACAEARVARKSAANKRRRRREFKLPGICANCGARYERRSPSQKYCDVCRDDAKLGRQRAINRRGTIVGQIRRSPLPRAMQDLSIAVTIDQQLPVARGELGERVRGVAHAQRALAAHEQDAVWDYRRQLLGLASVAVRLAAGLPVPANGHIDQEAEALRLLPALMLPR